MLNSRKNILTFPALNAKPTPLDYAIDVYFHYFVTHLLLGHCSRPLIPIGMDEYANSVLAYLIIEQSSLLEISKTPAASHSF